MQAELPVTPLPLVTAVSLESVLAVIVTIVFIWWVIFTLVVIYHWWKYSRDNVIAIPAVAVHIFVSGWIFVFATGGLH